MWSVHSFELFASRVRSRDICVQSSDVFHFTFFQQYNNHMSMIVIVIVIATKLFGSIRSFATDVLCSAHNNNNNNNNNNYYYYYYSHFLFVASSALCIFSRENLYCRRGWPLGTGWPPSGRTKNSLGHSINPLQKMLAVCAFRSFKRCVVSWPAVTGEFCPQNAYTFSSRFPVESNWQIQRHLEWVNVVRIPRIQRERKTVQGAQKSMPLSRIIIKSY